MTDNKKVKPIVFCNIGWCNDYLGAEDDPLIGGGSYVRENGTGNEDMNFLPFYVSTEGSDEEQIWLLGSFETKHHQGIPNQTHIERILGCSMLRKEEYARDVIVVWCATNPKGKSCVVGWYEHANVCRFYDTLPIDLEDGSEDERWYNVSCLYEDATLLPVEARSEAKWAIPRHNSKNPVTFGFGQSNIWYASEPAAKEFVMRMIHQIETYSGENAKAQII